MKNITLYSFSEYCRLVPLIVFFKQLRNDLLLAVYKRRRAHGEKQFITEHLHLRNKHVLIVVAFEQPKVLEWLFSLSEKNLQDFQLMVFDNSKKPMLRQQIKELCQRYQIPYLALPTYSTRHPNRSHGLAMTWIFHRIIKVIRPAYFGYLDHDMFPVKPIQLASMIPTEQISYGLLNDAKNYWNLWAGYCFFKFEAVAHQPLNFLYDFSRGVDTGGRNWNYLYRFQNKKAIRFASSIHQPLSLGDDLQADVQLIDDAWIHVGGVSYNNNLQPKELFYGHLVKALLSGKSMNVLKRHV